MSLRGSDNDRGNPYVAIGQTLSMALPTQTSFARNDTVLFGRCIIPGNKNPCAKINICVNIFFVRKCFSDGV